MTSALDRLIPAPPPEPERTRFGTVITTSPLTVRLDGDSNPVPVGTSTAPVLAGSRALVLCKGLQRIILGSLSRPSPLPTIMDFSGTGGTIPPGGEITLASASFSTGTPSTVAVEGSALAVTDGNAAGYISLWVDGAKRMDVFRVHSEGAVLRATPSWVRTLVLPDPGWHTVRVSASADPAGLSIRYHNVYGQVVIRRADGIY